MQGVLSSKAMERPITSYEKNLRTSIPRGYTDESVQLRDHSCAIRPMRVCKSATVCENLPQPCVWDYADESVQLRGHACGTMPMRVCNTMALRELFPHPCVCDYAGEIVQLRGQACATMPTRVCNSAIMHV